MRKKFEKTYMFLTVKTPIASFGLIFLFIIIFYIISTNTYIDQYEVKEAEMYNGVLHTKKNIEIEKGDEILFYENKNEFIYKYIVEEIRIKENRAELLVNSKKENKEHINGFIEIATDKKSILNLIFKK